MGTPPRPGALRAEGDWRTAMQLLKRMDRVGLKAESVHYGLTINACSRGGEMGKVRRTAYFTRGCCTGAAIPCGVPISPLTR